MNRLLLVVLALCCPGALVVRGQGVNRAPHFAYGGDMARLAVSEGTAPGAPVYTLQAEDPEGSKLHYSISGEHFTVDRDTGVVVLRRPLDREAQDIIEVIISITDEGIGGSDPNTVSLRREIAVLDENDNAPVFHGRPYAARVPENARVGGLLLAPGTILVTDRDGGVNADVDVVCAPASPDDDSCRVFQVSTHKLAEGKYDVQITLTEPLDYERRNSYLVNLVASDGASDPLKRLQAKATVAVDVLDVQDQPPTFVNAPYSTALAENTAPGSVVLTVRAMDGDTGQPRTLRLELQNEPMGYFRLEIDKEGDEILGRLITTNVSLDREDPSILQDGGIYSFEVKATELINGETPADSATSMVTIIVTDVDDVVPRFNEDLFNLRISEDIGTDTPLPGLNMIVTDEDMGENARYSLELRDAPNYPGVSSAFVISPEKGQGRTSIIIRARDPRVLDYDVPGSKELEFEVSALVHEVEVAYSTVHIQLLDANDHSPQFSQEIYELHVPEDAKVGRKFGDEVRATDADSNAFGELTYYLSGFGTEKFRTDPKTGGIYVTKPLDYETQKSYTLTVEAKDGGGKVTSVNVLIDLEDVNDNEPVFEESDYSRIVREGATSFEPQMFVTATDVDGPQQGDGKVTYSITQHNSMTDKVFKIDPETGELTFSSPAKSTDTERGIYELLVRATDFGVPSKYSETKVNIRVGVPGNQKPIFRGNFKSNLPGPNAYRARVLENAAPGTEVIRVMANDPDGRDNLLQYQISTGAMDNFEINSSSGVMTVSPDARLDLERNGDKYEVVVYAIDSGTPIRETATTTVTVNIVDVNNKPPVFKNSTYEVFVSERAAIGETVLRVEAEDPDSDADIEYSIVEPIQAIDKTGVTLRSSFYDYKTAFRINRTTGAISVNHDLDFQSAAVIIFNVEARDLNAVVAKEKQVALADVSVYIQAYLDDNPTFNNAGWTANNPTIRITVPEEQPLGTTLLILAAKEPQTNYPIQRFELVRNNSENEAYVNVGSQSGNVVLNKRLDYESLDDKTIKIKVRALTRDYEITRRMSEVTIMVTVEDINDNYPVFTQKDYKVSVWESDGPSKVILNVKATDLDSANSEAEIKRGFGVVRYSIAGENANYFEINPVNGSIRVATNTSLDRERQSVLRLYAIASDMPEGGADQKTARALVTVDVLDVNDNAPTFPQESYTAVVPENASVNVSIVNITATDPDEGAGGTINFEIIDEGEASGLLKINHTSGEIFSKRELTGKGRTEPYNLRVRAQDKGDLPLFTDVPVTLYIGDVVSNDGVPLFIRPTLDEVAQIAENSTIGSPVFQVLASDPDDPNLPNGKITFKFLEEGNFGIDASAFAINSETGLITTKKLLDREAKASYTLILVAEDLGRPPQQAMRVLQVRILDIDDHKPHFKRSFFSPPMEMSIKEETPVGSRIGIVTALDEDIGENGSIDYAIINGNDAGLFTVERMSNNSAFIRSAARLDREAYEKHLLTIKCFKYSTRLETPLKAYNQQDPTERQVLVKIIDIDDNRPRFKKDNFTIGIRLNVPTDSSLITLEAKDADPDALPIKYDMGEVDFVSLVDQSMSKRSIPAPLALNNQTGEIRSTGPLTPYADGYMEISISANNSVVPGRETNVTVRIFMLRDRDMLKFVFTKPPVEVRKHLEEFEKAVQQALLLPLTVNVYDTQFYAKDDHSLDFSSTSSCFQIIGRESYSLKEMKALLDDPKNDELRKVYKNYNVDRVQNCATTRARTDTSTSQLLVLIIAALIGVISVAASCTVCCMHSKYKKRMKHAKLHGQPRPTLSYVSSAPGMISSGSHTTLGPGTIVSIGPAHDAPGPSTYEWGNTLHRPSTLSRA